MEDLLWSLMLLLIGMGSVFVMLLVLMVLLQALGWIDKPKKSRGKNQTGNTAQENGLAQENESAQDNETAQDNAVTEQSPLTIKDASGLSAEEIAAITVAVTIHADLKRKQGAPSFREFAPGSRLWASRWVSMGRANQMQGRRR